LLQAADVRQRGVVAALGRQRYLHNLLHLMAVNAGHSPRFMRAAFPEQMCTARMAVLAYRVLLSYGVLGILPEAHRNRFFASAGFHVCPARPMTRFTTTSFLGGPWMRHHSAHGRVLEAMILILMARDAGLGPHI